MHLHRPLFSLLATFFLSLGGVSLTNAIVDPDGALRTNIVGLYFSTEREFKNAAAAEPFDTLILGSSRATYIPTKAVGQTKVLNAAWSGGVPEEFLSFLEARLRDQTVYIGFDLFMFNTNFQPNHSTIWGDWSIDNYVAYILNGQILLKSLRAIGYQYRGVASEYSEDGTRTTLRRDNRDRAGIVDSGKRDFSTFKYSEKRAAVLANIQSLCDKRGAKCVAFIGPINEHELEQIDTQAASQLARMREDVRAAFHCTFDFSESDYSKDRYFWKSDKTHYRPETALLFFSKIRSAKAC